MELAVESIDSIPLAKSVPNNGTLNRKLKKQQKKLQQKKLYRYGKFGTINVRTLRTDGKTYEVVKSIDEAGLLLTAIQEIKRLNNGEIDIQLPNNNHYKLIWTGNNIKRQEGVGVIIKQCNFIKLLDIEHISSRLMTVRVLIHNLNFKFVIAYAPTEDGLKLLVFRV